MFVFQPLIYIYVFSPAWQAQLPFYNKPFVYFESSVSLIRNLRSLHCQNNYSATQHFSLTQKSFLNMFKVSRLGITGAGPLMAWYVARNEWTRKVMEIQFISVVCRTCTGSSLQTSRLYCSLTCRRPLPRLLTIDCDLSRHGKSRDWRKGGTKTMSRTLHPPRWCHQDITMIQRTHIIKTQNHFICGGKQDAPTVSASLVSATQIIWMPKHIKNDALTSGRIVASKLEQKTRRRSRT